MMKYSSNTISLKCMCIILIISQSFCLSQYFGQDSKEWKYDNWMEYINSIKQNNKRIIQQDKSYTTLDSYIQNINILNISALDNNTRRNYIYSTQTNVISALSLAGQQLPQQIINTSIVQYNSSEMKIITIKASKQLFDSFLYTSPSPIFGSSVEQSQDYPNNTIFSITEIIFIHNPYRASLSYPYPDQSFPVVLIKVENNNDIMTLPKPLQYLFNSGLIYTGNASNQTSLASFMEQTRYVTCLMENIDFIWIKDYCHESTLILASGKILIQCNCNQSNYPVTIVNDTLFMYHNNPNANALKNIVVTEYVVWSTSAMFWIIIAITTIWGILMYNGHLKDQKTLKRHVSSPIKSLVLQGQSRVDKVKLNPSMQAEKYVVQKKKTLTNEDQLQLKNEKPYLEDNEKKDQLDNLNNLKQDSKKNSFMLEFDSDDEIEVKKTKTKKKGKKSNKVSAKQIAHISELKIKHLEEQALNDDPSDTPKTGDTFLPKRSKGQKERSDNFANNENEEVVLSTEPQDTPKAGENFLPKRIKGQKERSDNFANVEKVDEQQVELEINDDGEDDDEDEYEDEDEEENVEEQKQDPVFEKSIYSNTIHDSRLHADEDLDSQRHIKKDYIDEKNMNIESHKGNKEKEAPQLILPALNFRIFFVIFMRLHEFFSIFYYFQRVHSRSIRFLINYCKVMLTLGLCTQFAASLTLLYNVLLMLVALLLINWIENIADILLKQSGRVNNFMGIIVLALIMGMALYLIIIAFMSLLPATHQIWMYTFIIVSFLENVPIETIMIGVKTLLQPHLEPSFKGYLYHLLGCKGSKNLEEYFQTIVIIDPPFSSTFESSSSSFMKNLNIQIVQKT